LLAPCVKLPGMDPMTTGYRGHNHARLHRLFQNRELGRIALPTPTLNPNNNTAIITTTRTSLV